MRAFNTLLALSSCFAIDLLVFSMGLRKILPPQPEVNRICSSIVINVSNPVLDYRYWLQRIWQKASDRTFGSYRRQAMPICPGLTTHRQKKLQEDFGGKHYHTVHAFRIAVYPVFEAICNVLSYDRLQLDLDDIESDKFSQIMEMQKANGDIAQAEMTGRLAAAYQKLEESVLPTVEQIFVCSSQDRTKLKTLHHCRKVTVLPNVYPVPEKTKRITGTEKYRLLFVGRLGYEPNADAILYFCDQILPLLRRKAPSRFELRIIGDGSLLPRQTRKKLAQLPEIVMLGKVDDVGPYYQQADAAVVPLRAGGGTRLKILEAFAWQIPVVSTAKGIEGLEVIHGQHALIADTPLDFAHQCAKLMADPSLWNNLVDNARSLVSAKYSPKRLPEILCAEESL